MSEWIDTSDYSPHEHRLASFFNDISTCRELSDYYAAVERYICEQFALPPASLSVEPLVESGLLPEQDLELSDARVQCLLVPFRLVFSQIEMADTSQNGDITHAWLTHATSWLRGAVADTHTNSTCLVTTRKQHPLSCNHSIQCPIRTIRHILSEPVLNGSQEIELALNGDRALAKRLIAVRMRVALEQGLLNRVEADTLLRENKQYDVLMSTDLPRLQE